MRGIQIVGALLIVAGLLFFTNVISIATVIYDGTPPTITIWAPSGTQTSPTPYTPGQAIPIMVGAYDTGTGIDSAICEISSVAGDSYSNTLTLVYSDTMANYGDIYVYNGFTIPNLSSGTKLKFLFKVTDKNGNLATQDAYVLVGVPDGYFTINGQRADTTTVMKVTSPTLNFEFTATNLGSQIVKVTVTIHKGNQYLAQVVLTETAADKTWTGSYTLPSEGTYTVRGYLYVSETGGYQKMAILTEWGATPSPFPFGLNQMFGIALIAVGAVLALKKRW